MTEKADDWKIATNPVYTCPVCKVQLKHAPEEQSSIGSIKFRCDTCAREWTFCMICDSPHVCIKIGKCCRGFQEVERRATAAKGDPKKETLVERARNYIDGHETGMFDTGLDIMNDLVTEIERIQNENDELNKASRRSGPAGNT
jgi:hypothetical protein